MLLPWSVGKTSGHRLTLDWQATDDINVKSISSYRELKQSQYDTSAQTSVYFPNGRFARISAAHTRQSQYSEELQLVGSLPTLQFATGLFYYHEDVKDNAQSTNTQMFNATGTAATPLAVDLNSVAFDRASQVTSESVGIYGQATWTPDFAGDIAHLTVGGRLSHDKRKGSLDMVNGALPSYVNSSGQTITGIIPLDKAWTHVDPLVNLSIDLSRDTMVYGRWSTGYRAGGANSRSLTFRSFDPERVSMFEIGAKTQFWDNRVRFNVAAYSGVVHDAQIDFLLTIPGNTRATSETTNAARITTKGLEADLTVAPITGLTLSASYAYVDASPSRAFNPFTNVTQTVYPIYTPKHGASFAVDYARPVGNATLEAHLDANYSSRQYTDPADPTPSDSSTIVNGRIALQDIGFAGSDAKLEVALWSRNLLNEQYAFVRNNNAFLGTYGIFNEPRTYGLEVRVAF